MKILPVIGMIAAVAVPALAAEDTYVVVQDGKVSTFGDGTNLSMKDFDRRQDALICRRRGRETRVTDRATLAKVRAAVKPVDELSRQQSDLGRKQGDLGARQGKLGKLQGELGREQGKRGAKQAMLASVAAQIRDDDPDADGMRRRLDEKRADVADDQDALALAQRELGKMQAALGREQQKLGQEQQELSRRMEDASVRARAQLAALCDDASKDK